ncbi:uncharacterized protein METZ01_LOCUS418138, partial [marine metagenome]
MTHNGLIILPHDIHIIRQDSPARQSSSFKIL